MVGRGDQDGRRLEEAVHPAADLVHEHRAAHAADAGEGARDLVAHAVAEVFCRGLELLEHPRHRYFVGRGTRAERRDAAHREDLERGAARGAIGVERCHRPDERVCAPPSRGGVARERKDYVAVGPDAGETGVTCQVGVERVGVAADGLVDGERERIGRGAR